MRKKEASSTLTVLLLLVILLLVVFCSVLYRLYRLETTAYANSSEVKVLKERVRALEDYVNSVY